MNANATNISTAMPKNSSSNQNADLKSPGTKTSKSKRSPKRKTKSRNKSHQSHSQQHEIKLLPSGSGDKLYQHQDENHRPATTNDNNNAQGHQANAKDDKIRTSVVTDVANQLVLQNEEIQAQIKLLEDKTNKIKELETALVAINSRCGHFEDLLQQQLTRKTAIENDNQHLNHTLTKLRSKINDLERSRTKDEEKINLLNATLIERETEVSILKLKLTRVQTNLTNSTYGNANNSTTNIAYANASISRHSSNLPQDQIRAEAISSRTSLRTFERESSVWSQVPEELYPNRRLEILDKIDDNNQTSTPRRNNKRYQTLPVGRKAPSFNFTDDTKKVEKEIEEEILPDIKAKNSFNFKQCRVTNLDDSGSTNQSTGKTDEKKEIFEIKPGLPLPAESNKASEASLYAQADDDNDDNIHHYNNISLPVNIPTASPPCLPPRTPSTPVKSVSGLRKIFHIFKRSGSSVTDRDKVNLQQQQQQERVVSAGMSPFRRGPSQGRSTLVGVSTNLSPMRQVIKTDKPFAEWNNEMIADWLIMIGLSMYANQCRRWIKCGSQIMNATSTEVDRGLGISNPLHRKKLRLAISELNGDCDKITKAASKLDYLWVARWLDDIGLPQYKDKFIEARIDGRVLNYLTVEDLASMNITSVLHHASIRSGIKVLRSINFDLQILKRRATAEEIAHVSTMRQQIINLELEKDTGAKLSNEGDESEISLWTCHRVMEWLRLIDFAEYSSNLRGSGLNGALIIYEDGFNADTMCSILSIPDNKTLLRRHLKTFFTALIGKDLSTRKHLYRTNSSNTPLTPAAEIKAHRKSQFSLLRLKSSRVAQDNSDEYLCPIYPPDPRLFSPAVPSESHRKEQQAKLPQIPESVGV